ncbi:hypothetical protein HGI47_04255 [Novosphingobium sp. ERN07]|uniref:hypothetical protein n=1 Tax=Novosphingobium sp. ERN07 TaxID=2726187 RepID=UPI0017D47DCF|nr:hypothetical protein [Novosphingobium sp. ERN07]NLR70085.1 hypothetical protein [Novosphingobium sp. ERN07]
MFRFLFRPSHEKQCLRVLDIFATDFAQECAWEDIQRKVRHAVRQHSKDLERRIVFEGHRPKDVVGDMIANICLNDIEIGFDHTYRGVLSMNGQCKRNIFAKVITQQFADGWIDATELGIANENMKSAVAGAG